LQGPSSQKALYSWAGKFADVAIADGYIAVYFYPKKRHPVEYEEEVYYGVR
jgi:hypothetical protein